MDNPNKQPQADIKTISIWRVATITS